MLSRLGGLSKVCPRQFNLFNFEFLSPATTIVFNHRIKTENNKNKSFLHNYRNYSSPPQIKDPSVEAVFGSSDAVDELPSDATEFTIQLTLEELNELTNGDPELIKKVKYIQLEHEVYRWELF